MLSKSTIKANQGVAYHLSIDDALVAFGADAQRGLSDDEARVRLDRYGRNELEKERTVPAWKKFLAQFQSVLVILLLISLQSRC